jgi:hypothetical protein
VKWLVIRLEDVGSKPSVTWAGNLSYLTDSVVVKTFVPVSVQQPPAPWMNQKHRGVELNMNESELPCC